jgi:FKBP-type peptidyl-prolyl cis-trans isomerase FklB
MKKIFSVLVLCGIFCGAARAQKQPEKAPAKTVSPGAAPSPLKTTLDSFSYALGMNIANNLKAQGVTQVNTAMMSKAMNDVFAAKTPACSEQQANAVIQTVLQGNQGKKLNAEKERGKAFLAKNKTRAGVKTLPSGLQYEVLKSGDPTSEVPTLQDTVVAHYAGTLIDGKKFDNSYDRGEPLTIPVGGVIKGWTEILQQMHVGDKYKVYIPSDLAYGDRGAGADIPGGATLIFEMELIAVKKASANAKEAAPTDQH